MAAAHEHPPGGRLRGRVAMLTGAGGGLGRATARAMADEGALLSLTDQDEARLQETVAELRAAGASVVWQVGDVAQLATHRAWVARTQAAFQRIDVLANVAGVLGAGPLASATEAEFQRVMGVNCLAQMLAVQQVAPVMQRQGGGAIVNVASIGALVALPMMSLYCASKAAVLGLTRALALELGPAIRCNAVCPGGIDTPMARGLLEGVPEAQRPALLAKLTGRQLIPRFATPQEIAATIVFLASDDAAFLTGSVLAADGGHSAA